MNCLLQKWSSWEHPRGHILKSLASKLKSLAFASNLHVHKNALSKAQGQHCFLIVERKTIKHNKFLYSGIARIFDWGIRKSQQYAVIRCFQKERLFMRQKYLERKIRSLGLGLVRKQNVAKEGGLELKVNVLKYMLNFIVEARWKNYCNSNV